MVSYRSLKRRMPFNYLSNIQDCLRLKKRYILLWITIVWRGRNTDHDENIHTLVASAYCSYI